MGILFGHDVPDLAAFNPFILLLCFTGGCHSVTHRDAGLGEWKRWLVDISTLAATYKLCNNNNKKKHHTRTASHPCLDPRQSQIDATASLLSNPLTPSLSPSFYSTPIPASWPHSFLWLSWKWLTKPSLLPISSETGAGTMTASSPAERGRGKRGPWELQADTLRAVQVSSSPGLAEKRRLICCPCFPREGGCRREEGGRIEGKRATENEAERERVGVCSFSKQTA